MESSKKSAAEIVISLVSIITVAAIIFAPAQVLEKTAYISACAALPQGGYSVLLQYMNSAESVALTDSKEPEKAAEKHEKISSEALTATPQDILGMISVAKENEPNEKKDGDIAEVTYGKKGATSFFGNVLVKNTTATKSINIEKELSEKLGLKIADKTKPCILIFHTHATEGFEMLDRDWYASDISSRTADESRNIIRVGTEITQMLSAHGYNVIHDKTIHDKSYSGAYDRSRATVQKYLDKYPTISITLDIHRDAIQENNGTKIKAVSKVNGKKAAQIMIIAGAQEENITDFPFWQYNLRFALNIQKKCEELYPGIMRPIMFCRRKYNMDMTKYSLLIEMGSEANTLEEAAYSGKLLGNALAEMLDEM